MSLAALDWSVLTISERAELLRQRELLRNQTMAERVESLFSDGELEALESGLLDVRHALAGGLENLLAHWVGRDPKRLHIADRAAYQAYLQSDHWRQTRRYRLLRAGYRCQQCGHEAGRLEVHHLTYDRLGKERDDDLTVLCADCHAAEHGV